MDVESIIILLIINMKSSYLLWEKLIGRYIIIYLSLLTVNFNILKASFQYINYKN